MAIPFEKGENFELQCAVELQRQTRKGPKAQEFLISLMVMDSRPRGLPDGETLRNTVLTETTKLLKGFISEYVAYGVANIDVATVITDEERTMVHTLNDTFASHGIVAHRLLPGGWI